MKKGRFVAFLVLGLLMLGCGQYQKVLKEEDVKAKYDMAEKLYEAGDFTRANRLFEQIAPKYIGKPQGERVMYFFANSYYEIGDFNMAGYQFERFLKSYPKSDKAIEAAFLGAKSYYQLSPRYSLDQSDTDKALLKLQNFINAYPDSEYFAEANDMARELTTKKERKAFEIARQYNKIGHFDYSFLNPAITAFDNFVSDNPGSIYREAALYYEFDSAAALALNSYQFLKPKRLEEAKAAYDNLKKQFPETGYAKQADALMDKINKELEAIPAPAAK